MLCDAKLLCVNAGKGMVISKQNGVAFSRYIFLALWHYRRRCRKT